MLKSDRLYELIIPSLTWIMITLPIWLSPFHPAIVAYFIIAFDLYFFYNCLKTVYYSTISYSHILEASKIKWHQLLRSSKHSSDIYHCVIIPNYKEKIYKLEETIERIVKNDYPYKKIILMLAFEKREDEAKAKEQYFKQKFKNDFFDILASYHVLQNHEEPGKASNQSASAKQLSKYCQEKTIDPKKLLVTICDADSLLPINYFSYLTHAFLHDSNQLYHFFWAPVLLYNNFWKLTFFVRIQATLSSILRLSFLSQLEHLIQISTYSTNLWLLEQINYWDVDIIPEDWHVFFQAFFKFGTKVRTIPLYTVVTGDAVYSGTNVKTFLNRYDQERRWAWGVSDIGYAIKQSAITPHIPLLAKLKKIMYVAEAHLLWPSSFFILTLSASIPPLINPVFKRTVLGFLLPQLSGFILTLSSCMILVYVYLDVQLRKRIAIKTPLTSLPLMLIQWYFLPFISFFLSSLPALESHTRILLNKKITYKVTEKM